MGANPQSAYLHATLIHHWKMQQLVFNMVQMVLTIVLGNLIQQVRVNKPRGLFLSCKDDQRHQNISAMPGRQHAFGSVLRIDPQWGSLPSSVV